MSNYEFRSAVRENVGLWINLIAGTGGGKTFTGMRLASGIAGGKPFAVIDTENRRALHYADQFKFDHAELRPPFRPATYADAVMAADAAGYPVIMIDSGSHVWAGDGGVLDWQAEELDDMVERAKKRNDSRQEYQIRESGKMAAWIRPKMAHKQMVQKLLQVRAHIILCLRAEEKIEMVRKEGKTEIVKKQSLTGHDGWIPICEKNLPFEATCSFLLLASKPGVPIPIKLQEQHRELFPLDKPITEESGAKLARWAAGGSSKTASSSTSAGESSTSVPDAQRKGSTDPVYITADEALALEARCEENGIDPARLKAAAKVERLSMILKDDLPRAENWLAEAIERRKQRQSQTV